MFNLKITKNVKNMEENDNTLFRILQNILNSAENGGIASIDENGNIHIPIIDVVPIMLTVENQVKQMPNRLLYYNDVSQIFFKNYNEQFFEIENGTVKISDLNFEDKNFYMAYKVLCSAFSNKIIYSKNPEFSDNLFNYAISLLKNSSVKFDNKSAIVLSRLYFNSDFCMFDYDPHKAYKYLIKANNCIPLVKNDLELFNLLAIYVDIIDRKNIFELKTISQINTYFSNVVKLQENTTIIKTKDVFITTNIEYLETHQDKRIFNFYLAKIYENKFCKEHKIEDLNKCIDSYSNCLKTKCSIETKYFIEDESIEGQFYYESLSKLICFYLSTTKDNKNNIITKPNYLKAEEYLLELLEFFKLDKEDLNNTEELNKNPIFIQYPDVINDIKMQLDKIQQIKLEMLNKIEIPDVNQLNQKE